MQTVSWIDADVTPFGLLVSVLFPTFTVNNPRDTYLTLREVTLSILSVTLTCRNLRLRRSKSSVPHSVYFPPFYKTTQWWRNRFVILCNVPYVSQHTHICTYLHPLIKYSSITFKFTLLFDVHLFSIFIKFFLRIHFFFFWTYKRIKREERCFLAWI